MLWGKFFQNRVVVPVAGLLLALFWGELIHQFLPDFVPSLLSPEPAQAAVLSVDPEAPDGTTMQGTRNGCATANNYDCVNDGLRSPGGNPGTTDYVEVARNNQDNYNLGPISGVSVVTSITLHFYHMSGATSHQFQVGLYANDETTQFGTTQTLPVITGTPGWGSVTISGLSLTSAQYDALKVKTTCVRSGGGNTWCRNYAMYADVTYTPVINLTVDATGTQQNLDVGTTNNHVGGTFRITGTTGTWNVDTITITENGSVDASANLKNIKLLYDVDVTNPYTCDDQSYSSGDNQFGTTDVDGFSAADGTATFTHSGGVQVSSTETLCIYPVLDVQSGAGAAETIELRITNPTTDINVVSGTPVISPATPIDLPGTTNLQKTVLTQENNIWRLDDGNEAGATAITTENAPNNTLSKATNRRLRLAVYNDGNRTSDPSQFRLEYAVKTEASCDLVASGWTDVGAVGGDFDMGDTTFYTDGDNSNDIAAITNPDTTHVSGSGGLKDTSSQTGNITLTSSEFVELEYSIQAAAGVTDGTTYCFRVTNAGTPITYTNYPEATIAADLLVVANGTLTSQINIDTQDNYAGGSFSIRDNGNPSDTVTGITITGGGTADLPNDLVNVQLKYDVDTSDPYTCDDQSYDVTDTTFGSATTFNGSNKATFTDSVVVSTTGTLCVYVEYDVATSADDGDTVTLSIVDPSTEVVAGSASVSPSAEEAISGSTQLATYVIEQADFHWRDNSGDQNGADSATNGQENIALTDAVRNSVYRLRFSIGNTGNADAPEVRYRLQWAQKVSECSAIASWTNVSTGGDEWEMAPTGNLTQGDDTIDIAEGIGGVGTPAGTFLTDNNGIADDVDITASSTLPSNYYLDLEYSIRATVNAIQGGTYCFRVVANEQELQTYTAYAEATIKLSTDFKVQRNFIDATSTQVILIAGTHYEAPSSASSAFFRITNTQHTGAGPATGDSANNANDVTIYITNQDNILNNIILQRAPSPAGATRIYWEIVEYTGVAGGENEIIVRSSDAVTFNSANTVESGPVIGTVADDNDVVPFITSHYNTDVGRNSYNLSLATSEWNAINNQVDLTRGASGNGSIVTYSLVEFTGSNWRIQRAEHTFASAASTTEFSTITSVNSPSRAFLHTQKRTSENDHADYGQEVWLSGIGQISLRLDGDAAIPANHTAVVYVIENTQTEGDVMEVSRSSGQLTSGLGGGGPITYSIPIGATLDDFSVSSLFTNNRSNEVQRSWPEPILGAILASTTHYELWRSDSSSDIVYRTEVVQWPTAQHKVQQNYFALYENGGGLTPTTTWAGLGETFPMTADDNPMAPGDTVRIRMTLSVTGSTMPINVNSFRLVYGKRFTTCSAVSEWHPVGEIGSTTAPWRGYDNGSVVDGATLDSGNLLISIATVAGTYEEENNSALNPSNAFPGDEVEYDWVVQHNGADDKSSYCFRMEEADGTPLNNGYGPYYPVLRTVGFEPLITNWRWYDDETNATPSTPLAAENFMPSNVAFENAMKLRVVVQESSGAAGANNRFALQYSTYSDFSQSVNTVTDISECSGNSLWCYYDGAGTDAGIIDSAVISNADPCSGGVGVGCGTYNEGTTTAGYTFDQQALASTEYEFTIIHDGAKVNQVYYFRLYDLVNDLPVTYAPTYSYPSLMTEGAALSFGSASVGAGVTIGDITTDVPTTPSSVAFDSVPFNTSYEAAQQITVDTNATEGYQLLQYADSQLLNGFGDEIPAITSTNAVPAGWSTACTDVATACFGYHTTDSTLGTGVTSRFGAVDSYAAFDTTPQEVMYSSIPTSDTVNIVYRILVTEQQTAGDYETNITYIVTPVH